MLAPLVVIGLGGIGSEIVAKLEKKVTEKQIKGKMLFATIDTDINTINKIRWEGFNGCIIQLSKNTTVRECLKRSTSYQKWFQSTESLDIKSMTEGAGQVRAVSRLALDVAIQNGKLKELEEKIGALFQIGEYEVHQAPRVLIISSLAGGTGSGIVLPIALYLRKFFDDVLHSGSVIIKGMFIMSDVFREILGNNYERVSIDANTYAAIKELEAFSKKGEGILTKNYNDKLHLCLSEIGTDNEVEYIALPYNYCYLFGAKNTTGYSLRSFQDYQDYVVECIYAQAFSPMQDLNNSIEDNVFRIASTGIGKKENNGFRRFCCCGTAVLNYPYNTILKWLALQKAEKILKEQWQMIDQAYYAECCKVEARNEAGKYQQKPDKRDFYRQYIEVNKSQNPFLKSIYQECLNEVFIDGKKDGEEKSWEAYWTSIEKSVQSWLEEDNVRKHWNANISALIKDIRRNWKEWKPEKINRLVYFFTTYELNGKNELERKRSMAGAKFFAKRMREEYDETYFEYWILKNDTFIHPNAVRYFLYQVIALFEQKCDELKRQKLACQEELEKWRKRDFEIIQLSDSAFINHFFRKKEIEKIISGVNAGIKALENYQEKTLLLEVVEQGIEFLERLSKQYEQFYDVFQYNVERYAERAEDLKKSIQNVEGTVGRYVCSSDKVLEYLKKLTINVQNDTDIASSISEVIYRKLYNDVEEYRESDLCEEIFQKTLIDYWQEELEKNYASVLKMDILTALRWEGKYFSRSIPSAYAAERMNHMWSIASPFAGIDDQELDLSKNFCTYSLALEKKTEHEDIELLRLLKDSGGSVDTEGAIDEYTIVFYQVIYALSPTNLKELKIEWNEKKQEFNMGTIAQGYYQMLDNSAKTRMTPHIDWSWNRFDIMPDFNVEYQKSLERLVYQVFLYCCTQSLSCDENSKNTLKYFLEYNGERKECATLHEMFLQYFVTDYSNLKIEYEKLMKNVADVIRDGKTLDDCIFIENLKKNIDNVQGIFQIIQCVNIDGGINDYDQSVLRNMISAIIDLLLDIYLQFEEYEDAVRNVKWLIEEQWKGYCRNCEDGKIKYYGFIVQDMCYAIKNKLGIELTKGQLFT